MRNIVSIVEGYGDHLAVPHLIAKLGRHFGAPAYSGNPIRAGEWKKLRRPGELERTLELARHRGGDHILVLLDLEDFCPVAESADANIRVNAWLNGRPIKVSIVFLVKEYESIFLASARAFCSDENVCIAKESICESVRDAKGQIKDLLGRRYKEVQDQEVMTKKVDVPTILEKSRSFRKLAKELFGYVYPA